MLGITVRCGYVNQVAKANSQNKN